MRSLRLFSFGTGSPSRTPQTLSSKCKCRVLQWPSASIPRPFHLISSEREGINALICDLRSRPGKKDRYPVVSKGLCSAEECSQWRRIGLHRSIPQLLCIVRGSLRDAIELPSPLLEYSGYGGHLSLALQSGHRGRRLSTSIAGKKEKMADRNLLVEDTEEDVAEAEEEEIEEKLKAKKKLKVKKKHEGLVAVDDTIGNGKVDTELKQKKKKLKEAFEMGGDGLSRLGDVAETAHIKVKKKKYESIATSGSGLLSEELVVKHKEKKKRKSKQKIEESDEEDLDEEGDTIAIVEDFVEEEEETVEILEADVIDDELGEHLDDDDFWEEDSEPEPEVGDGGDGGGFVLGDVPWAGTAFNLAEEVVAELNSDLALFAFKVSKKAGLVRVRLDKIPDKYGSPTMEEIENFSAAYRRRLEQAGEAGDIPDDLALEVSSPGAERVLRIPEDLERFKELPMYVRYVEISSAATNENGKEAPEEDGILELEYFNAVEASSVWKLADVRINRDLAGKGRGLTRKQRDWRVKLPLDSLQLVRLYLDV